MPIFQEEDTSYVRWRDRKRKTQYFCKNYMRQFHVLFLRDADFIKLSKEVSVGLHCSSCVFIIILI